MVSYLAMATGLGISYIGVHGHTDGGSVHLYRQAFWARDIDWLFTTPLLLLSLALLAGLSPASTMFVISADVFMIVTGALATVKGGRWNSDERAKWAFFTVSCIGFVAIWVVLFSSGLKGESDLYVVHTPSRIAPCPSLLVDEAPSLTPSTTAASLRPRKTKGLFYLLSVMTFL